MYDWAHIVDILLYVLKDATADWVLCLYCFLGTWITFRLSEKYKIREQERVERRKETKEPVSEFIHTKEVVEVYWFGFIFVVGLIPLVFVCFMIDSQRNSFLELCLSLILISVIVAFLARWFWIRIKKVIPYVDIAVDEDGLWHKHKTKEKGLVPWDKIAGLKIQSDKLDVLDANNQRLMQIYGPITDFDILRDMLLETVKHNRLINFPRAFSSDYEHGAGYKIIIVSFMVFAICFGLVLYNPTNAGLVLFDHIEVFILVLLTLFILFVFIRYKYTVFAHGVEVNSRNIIILYALQKVVLKTSEVDDINIINNEKTIQITTRNKKKYLLNIGPDIYMCYLALKQTKEECDSNNVQ